MKEKSRSNDINGENIVYHIIQKQIIEKNNENDPPREVKYMIEQLLLWGGVWFRPETYQQIPVLLPYVVRDSDCRKKDPSTGKDSRGIANIKGFMPDDNSSIKGIPKSLPIQSILPEMNGKRLGKGYVASHCWRVLKSKPTMLASKWECTNSFIPNLVWLPKQLSKLTDREGSYAQRFVQYLSCLLYRNIDLRFPMLSAIWKDLDRPVITPVSIINISELNYFENNNDWVKRRKNILLKELQSILNILDGRSPIVDVINVSKYAPSLQKVVKKNIISPTDKSYLKKWIKENISELVLDNYWTRQLIAIGRHIMLDCDPANFDYSWAIKGFIITDENNGILLSAIEGALKYDELIASGKVNEITIDKSWPLNDNGKCWKIFTKATNGFEAGLLVINVYDIHLFDCTWCIKQLAKQEAVKFRGYVLLVIRNIPWLCVKEYAEKHAKGDFDAMFDFYRLISL